MIADVKVWRAWYRLHNCCGMDGMMVFIVSTTLSGEDIYQKRNSVEECLEFINKDLDDVISITDDEILSFLWDE